ncbi:MAG: succinyl-diaminopimelate desuccinylase, partial [Actinomycetota bacterium]|nr:succinyl-diaminopimelate desuccinylase [Actinomycetota bacterium]
MLELTEQLCAVPSVSGSETELADLVETSLRERAPQLEITRVGANVIARTNA